MEQFVANPIKIAYSIWRLFNTGKVPGCAKLMGSTWELGAPPNAAESGEKALDSVLSWA